MITCCVHEYFYFSLSRALHLCRPMDLGLVNGYYTGTGS